MYKMSVIEHISTHLFAQKFTQKLIYFAADLFLPNSPRSSLHPNNINRINRRMTAFPNAKSMLPFVIDTVTRPYANGTATTLETVSRVSSSNLSSIDDDGELLVSSCLRCFSKKQLPSSLPLLLSRTDKCTGNGGLGSMEYSAITGRLGLGLLGLESEALGSGALLARDRDNQLSLGLGK